MSIGFCWFKNYEIKKYENPYHGFFNNSDTYMYDIIMLDGGDTSHSAGNIIPIQNLLRENFNIAIPHLETSMIEGEEYLNYFRESLIVPNDMSYMLDFILRKYMGDEINGLKDRIGWLKSLSDEGFYIMYDA